MIDASTRILSSVYARHSDRMSVGIFFRDNGLRGGYPPSYWRSHRGVRRGRQPPEQSSTKAAVVGTGIGSGNARFTEAGYAPIYAEPIGRFSRDTI